MAMRRLIASFLTVGAIVGAVPLALPLPAEACGGLFCRRTPVDQAGERILFAADGENVTAHVQIQYQGDADQFSWVVPVPTEPKLEVGSDALFTLLRNGTRPQFNLTIENEGKCKEVGSFGNPQASAVQKGASSRDGVTVVSQEQVGPYDSAVIKSDDANALRSWLKENDYDLPAKLDPLLDPYVSGKYYFVALKLTSGTDVGDIQPIVLNYKSTKPGVPIRLTGIAATPDMAVYVWVLGDKRSIPENYRHAVINEARIDWLNQGRNYTTVVTEAMNEAGGQAFVTDYAGDSSIISTDDFKTDEFKLEQYLEVTEPTAFASMITSSKLFTPIGTPSFNRSGPNRVKMLSFLKRYIAKPDVLKDVEDNSFYFNMSQYKEQLAAAQVTVDSVKAVKELEDTIKKPYDEIRALFTKFPYLTQLFTTMSPDEMTQDPMFIFNGDMPKVSNMHEAKGVRLCSSDVTFGEAPIRITLANGQTFFATNGNSVADGTSKALTMPAAARIEQLKGSGSASIITDNKSKISKTIGAAGAIAIDPTTGKAVTVARPGGFFGCAGCAAGNSPVIPNNRSSNGEGLTFALLLMGWFGYRRYQKGR